jgi:hypothetical protein
MKHLLPILFVLGILSTASKCKDDTPSGTASLNFKAKFNDSPLVMNQVYDYNGKKLRFTKLSFYMKPNNYLQNPNAVPISSILITKIDFTNLDSESKAVEGITYTYPIYPMSKTSYTTYIGIESNLNALKPKDFESNSPLSNTGDYWDAWNSYIFTKLEGTLDKDGDGKFETGITLHTGGNEVYTPLTFTKSFTITEGVTTPLNFELNVNKLIDGIDLVTVNSTHQTGDLPTMKKFIGNFSSALILK